MARVNASIRWSSELDGVRILVVDDDADARELLAAVLGQRGAVIFVAATAAEALDVLASESVDALVSDIAMPEEDGYMLVRKVRLLESGRHLPIIAVSAHASRSDRTRAFEAGFDRHVAKPVDLARLVATIRELAVPEFRRAV
jgi:CheY-like chemotaxis protein